MSSERSSESHPCHWFTLELCLLLRSPSSEFFNFKNYFSLARSFLNTSLLSAGAVASEASKNINCSHFGPPSAFWKRLFIYRDCCLSFAMLGFLRCLCLLVINKSELEGPQQLDILHSMSPREACGTPLPAGRLSCYCLVHSGAWSIPAASWR